jgi:hypothetical protein
MLRLRFLAICQVAAILAAAGTAVPLGHRAAAEPLGKEQCALLKKEHAELLTDDMQYALDHGPDWVKSHLENDEIEKVRTYLIIEEKLEFQCRKGAFIRDYINYVPLPDRRPAPPQAERKVVSTSQARAD